MRALLALLVALVPSLALAAEYRLPLNGCDTPSKCVDLNKCYVTAYMDLDGAANGLRDWNCGQNTYDGHQGTDIAIGGWAAMDASGGSRPVVAAATGTVVVAFDGQFDRNNDFSLCGTSQAPGNHVAIRHPNGFTTVYLHLKKGSVAVTQGQTVSCGDKLGEVGSSGCSTGPHLHFEVNTTSVLFQSPDDPYAAASGCGGPLSYWVDQGPYCRLPGTCCQGGCNDQATFVSETIPDGTTIQPNATFTKKWTLRNSGGSTWTRTAGYQFAFDGEQQFGAPAITQLGASESVAPGATKEWSLSLKAPAQPGRYRGYWRMERSGGARFGDRVWVEIVVPPPAGTKDFDNDGHDSVASGGADCDDFDPTIYPGAPELCDGRDNDCNGQKDENLTRVCDNFCGAGTQTCQAGEWKGCTAPGPKPESCNGLDDDCDGQVDDGELCSGGQVCRGGRCVEKGSGTDAGLPPADAGAPDAMTPSGPPGEPVTGGGCGCAAGDGAAAAPFALAALAWLTRRRRR